MRKDKIKKKFQMKMSRRQVLKAGIYGGAGLMLPWRFLPAKAFADPAATGLNDPSLVDKFVTGVPDALHPDFKYNSVGNGGNSRNYRVSVGRPTQPQQWGTKEGGTPLKTDIYGYGDERGPTWPGRTFEVQSGRPVQIQWENNLDPNVPHLLPVDTSLHWCYSLPGYTQYSIANDGVPIVTHVHGHHSQYRSDGNPEEFFTYRWKVKGPRFRGKTSIYHNDQPAGNLWYHDHALGITRLNVYAGLAGFYFVRDDMDTGLPGNPLNLPAWPYEKAYAIQDRMFDEYGQLFYPAFPGDPFYDDFIETPLPDPPFGDGGPTALAEFFGDHMVVNGIAWPKEEVEPRRYRMHLLNGCDSRFMVIRFRVAGNAADENTTIPGDGAYVPFYVIGSDQGLASSISPIFGPNGYLVFEPGSRYDIIVDFTNYTDKRIIMENIGADEPFNGEITGPGPFTETDRIMAFDVVLDRDEDIPNVNPTGISFGPDVGTPTRTRKVALFEGRDEYERLQPLLGTAEPAVSFNGKPINWPNTQPYIDAGLVGQMEGAIAWHSPVTENPKLNTTEEWEIWNGTGDAHPIHLHLVHFEIFSRKAIKWDTATGDGETEFGRVADPIGMPGSPQPNNDGTYLVVQPVVQHNGAIGSGFRFANLTTDDGIDVNLTSAEGYVENARHDMVTALPDQVTIIRAKFDKPGRFVWHCHILSHEDHEMMRTLYVGPEF
jgi:FtsP/CotA-like multicopper oxidase with cupredoxin domain